MNERNVQHGDGEIAVCHVCGQTFETQRELSDHLMNDHEGERLPDVTEEFP